MGSFFDQLTSRIQNGTLDYLDGRIAQVLPETTQQQNTFPEQTPNQDAPLGSQLKNTKFGDVFSARNGLILAGVLTTILIIKKVVF